MKIVTKKYEEIYEELKDEIVGGGYAKGDKLPSKRAVAFNEDVSVTTVEHAYELLESEGYISGRERSGYYVEFENCLISEKKKRAVESSDEEDGHFAEFENRVISEKKKRTVESGDEEDGILNEPTERDGEGEEKYFPLTVYAKAVRAVLADYGEKLFEKSPPTGHPVLKQAIARYLNRNRGIRAKAENVIIGSGSEYFYGIIADMLGTDKTYAVEKPCYEKIKKIYELKGITVEELALGANGIKTKELQNSSATVLHVTPYGSYPTGVTANARKREEYIGWARKRGGVIIEDDFQSEFCLNARLTQTLFASNRKCVIYLNTFSKTIFPSMRAGYMALPDDYAKLYYEKLGFYSCTVPLLEQLVIAKILNDGSFERHLNKLRRHKKLSCK